ncbi:MAG: TetR/AcrR family transcriptional regulator [Micromonosporaceae bacterium]
MGEPVKGKTEAGRRREEQARLRRQRVVDAALRLFLERGYVATTIEAIAREAHVAPATVYQAFGSKQAILTRVLDVTIAGDSGPAALLDRDWVRKASQHPDPRQRLALVIQHTSGVAARTAPIKEVMRDATATDPAIRQLLREDDQRRRLTQQSLIDLVIGRDSLRAGCDRDHAAATFFAMVNSHSYQLLASHLGWSPADWQQWLTEVLTHELFGDSQPAGTHAPPRHPARTPGAGDRQSG